jgi:hypothetical protein
VEKKKRGEAETSMQWQTQLRCLKEGAQNEARIQRYTLNITNNTSTTEDGAFPIRSLHSFTFFTRGENCQHSKTTKTLLKHPITHWTFPAAAADCWPTRTMEGGKEGDGALWGGQPHNANNANNPQP